MTAPKRRFIPFIYFALIGATILVTPACHRKSGCPVNEEATAKVDRKGNFAKKKTSTNLFPKDMRKKMGH